jgi:hypothetical protein
MSPETTTIDLFLTLPRKVLAHYFVLVEAMSTSSRDAVLRELKRLLDSLITDTKTDALVRMWERELESQSPSNAAKSWLALKNPSADLDLKSLRDLVESLLYATEDALSADGRLKEINPKSQLAVAAAQFCIQKLIAHTKTLSPEQRAQFRRSQRIAYCRSLAQAENRNDILPYMTENLFTERVIPEVTAQLKVLGLYVLPRRPKKEVTNI